MKITLGDRLRELRNSKSLTQLELSRQLNISKSNISKYENNTIEPNLEILDKIANFFDVSVDYLLGRVNIKNPYVDKKEETKEPKKDPFDAFETFAAHQKEGGITNEKDLANMVEDIVKRLLEEKEKDK